MGLSNLLLRGFIKTLAAQSPEKREEWLNKLEAQYPAMRDAPLKLGKLADTAAAAEYRPRVPGTRWLPPPEVAAPVLAVHLDGPDRLMGAYRGEHAPEVAPTGHPIVVNGPGGVS